MTERISLNLESSAYDLEYAQVTRFMLRSLCKKIGMTQKQLEDLEEEAVLALREIQLSARHHNGLLFLEEGNDRNRAAG